MVGKVFLKIGSVLYVIAMVALGLWYLTDLVANDTSTKSYADWRWIVVMAMLAGAWMMAHLFPNLLEEEKKKEEEKEKEQST